MHIGPIHESDLDAVLAVQAACYPAALQEAADVVLGRMRAAPGTILVARAGAGVAGYLFAYPSRRGKVTALGGAFAPAPGADTLYLHDLAVPQRSAQRTRAAGTGAGGRHADVLLMATPETRYQNILSLSVARKHP